MYATATSFDKDILWLDYIGFKPTSGSFRDYFCVLNTSPDDIKRSEGSLFLLAPYGSSYDITAKEDAPLIIYGDHSSNNKFEFNQLVNLTFECLYSYKSGSNYTHTNTGLKNVSFVLTSSNLSKTITIEDDLGFQLYATLNFVEL